MLAWSEELITDVRKPGNHGHGSTVSCCRMLSDRLTGLLTPTNSNQQGADATTAPRQRTLRGGGWKLPKSQDAVALQQIKERGATLPQLVVVISVRQSTVAAISGLHCRALVMVSSSIRQWPDCKIQRSGRNGRSWCMSRVTAIISTLVSVIVTLSWAIITVITPLPTKPATKMQRTEAGERGNYWHADASAWCCCAHLPKYTKEI